MDEFECHACGSFDGMFLGVLGNLEHYRCRDCGMDSHVEIDPERDHMDEDDREPREDHFMTDAEADADVLASAGFGTDEDYGYFGGNDDF